MPVLGLLQVLQAAAAAASVQGADDSTPKLTLPVDAGADAVAGATPATAAAAPVQGADDSTPKLTLPVDVGADAVAGATPATAAAAAHVKGAIAGVISPALDTELVMKGAQRALSTRVCGSPAVDGYVCVHVSLFYVCRCV